MTYTLLQYETVAPSGEPLQPPSSRALAQAFGSPIQLAATTVYAVVIPDANMYLRISNAGSEAAAGDYLLAAGEPYGFPVAKAARPSVYGTAAA